jgi:hypothetical protein
MNLAGDTATPAQPHRGIRLLPYFDAYVVAGQPRERLYPGAAAARALTLAGQALRAAAVWHPLALGVQPRQADPARRVRRGHFMAPKE